MHNLDAAARVSSLLLCASGTLAADVKPQAAMLRWPDISAQHICFVYANDIWLAPREGGVASPLASPTGQESFPRFSPDGQTIGFVGNYDGNTDLYTLPIAGGVPFRVTHHPANETLSDWAPDGRLLYVAGGMGGVPRAAQMFAVAPAGGLPEPLPVPYSGFGSISPDGDWLAYSPYSTDTRTWKRYRGGMATDLWLFNLKDRSSRRFTDWEGTDTIPMWVPGGDGATVYYLSDAGPEHRLNLWAFDVRAGTRRQVTSYADNDVRWPSIGPGPDGKGEIIFQLGSEMRVFDLGASTDRVVEVTIPGARPTIRVRSVDSAKQFRSASISPTGKRIAVEARGDIWSNPAKEGVVRNLTRTDSIFDRDPAWSPDGRWIAYFSDASGEYELWVRPSGARPPEKKADDEEPAAEAAKEPAAEPATEPAAEPAAEKDAEAEPVEVEAASQEPGPTEPRQLTNLGAGFRYSPHWSPDSKSIVFTDKAGGLWLCDVATGTATLIDTDPWTERASTSWSKDSAWLAYDRSDEASGQQCIWLLNIASGQATRVTEPMFNSSVPVFDAKGDYLLFQSNRAIASPIYADLDTTFIYANTEQLFLVPLRADLKSPWAPKSDEEELKEDKKEDSDKKDDAKPDDEGKNDEGKDDDGKEGEAKDEEAKVEDGDKEGKDDKKAKKDAKADAPVKIDLEGMEARAIAVPVPAGAFGAAAFTKDNKLIYVRRTPRGVTGPATIRLLDLEDEEREEKKVVEAGGFELCHDRSKILVFKGGSELLVMDPAPEAKSTTVPMSGMRATVDPRAEWRQIFTDTWRLNRDFFYEPTMHGVDWAKMREHYGAMIEDCASREDVAWVQAEMVSELNVGHAYITGAGDVEQAPSIGVGLLGCDFELVAGEAGSAYRIKAIHRGAPWDVDARGPLGQPGIDAKVGDYLLAVNGALVDASRDPWASLVGTADRPTTITLGPDPVINEKSRELLIRPMGSEADLRYRAWVEKNRAYVAEKTGGKVGYIYVPNTGVDGQNELFRQFFGQRACEALIIDERWNGGGQIPTRFVELLNRPITNYWARRDGKDWTWPPDSHAGPKCMLINGRAGSGGDAFPAYFKRAGLGKLIGTRTWGGLVGISGNPGLIDGGSIAVPTFGYYKTDGNWGIEGHGVDPDIEVLDDPALMQDGGDPQLDRAIAEMLAEVQLRPYKAPQRPASPDRKGMGLPPEQR
jgi:tricorn protease